MKITIEPVTETSNQRTVTVSKWSDDQTLSDMLELIESALRGCGFYFDGHLDIIDDEDNGTAYRAVILGHLEWLRKQLKHINIPEDAEFILSKARDELNSQLDNANVRLD